MAFYIIEKREQLYKLKELGDCFIDIILGNDNYHPAIIDCSLIYLRPLSSYKGYIICIDHSESHKMDLNEVLLMLIQRVNNFYCINKKNTLYHFPYSHLLFDISFIEIPELKIKNKCIEWYYSKFRNSKIVNKLIPISKHYEKEEEIFKIIEPIIKKGKLNSDEYIINNNLLTNIFFEIEKNGIKLDKKNYITYYNHIEYPEFFIKKGRIYTQYNLYTTTGRPSNRFNGINFSALKKNNGERKIIISDNSQLIEIDYQGYHPRLAAKIINYNVPENKNIYDYLNIEKIEMFENLYGGILEENKNKPFFNELSKYLDNIKIEYKWNGYKTKLRHFNASDKINENKLLSYILQAEETYENLLQLENILKILENKKTKIILYTYDAFLFDYAEEDGEELLNNIKNQLKYPFNVKQGKNYHILEKTDTI